MLHDFLVPRRFHRRLLGEEGDGASRIEHRAIDLVERREALLVRGRFEIVDRDQLVSQPVGQERAVLDEDVGVPLDEPIQLLMSVEKPDDDGVDREQRRRADEAPCDAVIFPDDRVLHGVRQRQEHDQIEGVQLRQLALARQTQPDDKEEIDDDRPKHLLRNRHHEVEHVANERSLHTPIIAVSVSPITDPHMA